MAREWTPYKNSRDHWALCCEGEHVSLSELIEDPQLDNHYLRKWDIPSYPESVVFYAPNVMHVTGESGLRGIFSDGGFRVPYEKNNDNLLCFSLSVTDEDIYEAEHNFLEQLFPCGWNQQKSFLKKFTTSPAFQSESRYGNFRFTFPLRELLYRYGSKFCHGTAPVFHVYDTKLYKQEIVYSVVVHPKHISDYNHLPRLPRDDEGLCGYFGGQMSWCCQAPSDALRHWFTVDEEWCTVNVRRLRSKRYYVWDHVIVAFHMEPQWVLRVNPAQLYKKVTVCEVSKRNLLRYPDVALSMDEATKVLEDLGREYGLV